MKIYFVENHLSSSSFETFVVTDCPLLTPGDKIHQNGENKTYFLVIENKQ